MQHQDHDCICQCRSLRLTLFGFCIVSASVGTLVSVPQLIGALGGAPNALEVETVLQNIAINVGAIAIFGFLFRSDWQARQHAPRIWQHAWMHACAVACEAHAACQDATTPNAMQPCLGDPDMSVVIINGPWCSALSTMVVPRVHANTRTRMLARRTHADLPCV